MDNYLFDTRGMSFCRKDSFGSLVEIFKLVFSPLGRREEKENKRKGKRKRKRK